MKRLICLLAVAVIFIIPVSAESSIPSPTGTEIYSIKFYQGNYNELPYTVEVGKTFTANIDLTKGNWNKWTFFKLDGSTAVKGTDYEMISGTSTSYSIEIKPHTDLIVCANYDELIVPVQPKKSKSLLKSSPDNTDDDNTKDDEEKDVDIGYKTTRKLSIVFLYVSGVLFGMLISHLLMCWVVDKND